jgi:pimeloyl-ACP methyl ester carboxylesterase
MIAFQAAGRAISGIPAWVYALADGAPQPFRKKAEGMYRSLGNASLLGLVLGCERGWSQQRLQRVRKESQTALLNADSSPLPQACAMLGIQPSDHAEDVIFSPVRTLFISGTLDSAAPPFQAEHVRFGFPNGSHVVVNHATHDTLALAGVQDLNYNLHKRR